MRQDLDAFVASCARTSTDEQIHFAQELKVGWKEDIKVAWLDHVGGAGHHGSLVARLDHGPVHALDCVRQMREVRQDEPVLREMLLEDFQEQE